MSSAPTQRTKTNAPLVPRPSHMGSIVTRWQVARVRDGPLSNGVIAISHYFLPSQSSDISSVSLKIIAARSARSNPL